jgi:hypothetical protein
MEQDSSNNQTKIHSEKLTIPLPSILPKIQPKKVRKQYRQTGHD